MLAKPSWLGGESWLSVSALSPPSVSPLDLSFLICKVDITETVPTSPNPCGGV